MDNVSLSGVDLYDISHLPACRLCNLLWKIVPPFLLIFGTIGNIFSIIVLRSPNLCKSVSALYLTSLAVADIFALHTGLLRQWIKYTFDVDIRYTNLIVCKLHRVFTYMFQYASVWTLVAVTVDRAIVVWFPLRSRVVCTKITTIGILIIIYVFSFSICSPFLHGIISSQIRTNHTHILSCEHFKELEIRQFMRNVWPWIDLTFYCFLPFCIMIVSNILLITHVISARRKVEHYAAGQSEMTISVRQRRQRSAKETSMAIILISISVVFVILTTPIIVYLLFFHHHLVRKPAGQSVEDFQKFVANMEVFYTVSSLLAYLNHSCNFLLYNISGSLFRKEATAILCRRRQKVVITIPNNRRMVD